MSSGFEQNAEFFALAAREAREEARRLLARIEVVISGLSAKDPAAGLDLRRSAVEFLVSAGDAQTEAQGRRGDSHLSVVGRASDRSGDVDPMIVELLEGETGGMHVDAIHELLCEMGSEITKGNLAVKLHRMIKSGRLVSTARGYYALSSMERARRPAV
jgi:DNA-binding transcriptional regulator PaaX